MEKSFPEGTFSSVCVDKYYDLWSLFCAALFFDNLCAVLFSNSFYFLSVFAGFFSWCGQTVENPSGSSVLKEKQVTIFV